MNRKYIYTALIGCAIALTAIPIQAKENTEPSALNTAFVCATQEGTPTMFTYTPGKVDLNPIMAWYPEYLLPGQSGKEVCEKTATKLQTSIEQEQAKYIKSETPEAGNLVCLTTQENQNCNTDNSEKLFSVNPKYDASCVLDNKQPLECKALQVRGNIYSFEDKPYQPMWWPW